MAQTPANLELSESLSQVLTINSKTSSCSGQADCLDQYEAFCAKLNSPEHGGAIRLPVSGDVYSLLSGKPTGALRLPENTLIYLKSIAAAETRGDLPSEFKSALAPDFSQAVDAFEKAYEGNTSRGELSKSFKALQSQILKGRDGMEAMSGQGPDLLAKAVWSNDPAFLRVQKEFLETKQSYLRYLASNPDFSDAQKKQFAQIIERVTLSSPGLEYQYATDGSCALKSEEVFYRPESDRVVICPGAFLSGKSFELVMAHELSHALGIDRQRIEALRSSELGSRTASFIRRVCTSHAPLACTPEMKAYLDEIPALSSKVKLPNTLPLDSVRSCLKHAPVTTIQSASGEDSPEYTRILKSASIDEATRRTVAAGIDVNVTCSSQSDFSADSLTPGTKTHIAAIQKAMEACSKSATQAELNQAILPIVDVELRFGGGLSNYNALTENGFSENTEEDFADYLAAGAFAENVKTKFSIAGLPDEIAKKNFFFANAAIFCGDDDAAGAHGTFSDRRKNILSAPLRNALSCKQDSESSGDRCKVARP